MHPLNGKDGGNPPRPSNPVDGIDGRAVGPALCAGKREGARRKAGQT